MRYVITGHLGLIGKELKKRLDKEGNKCVFGKDRRTNLWSGEVDTLILKDFVKADIFFHLADNVKIQQIIENPRLAKENVNGVCSALEYCKRSGIKKFVYFSSSRVLNKEKNPYVAGKIYGEELCKAYYECYGIEYLIIRPSTVYGPGIDESNRLMYIFCSAAKENKDIVIYGNKYKTLDFTYIDDFLDAIMIALKNEWNREYNIGGGEEKISNVVNEIIHQANSKSKVFYKDPQIAQPQNVKIDSNELRVLGWEPKIDIKEGIRRCLI